MLTKIEQTQKIRDKLADPSITSEEYKQPDVANIIC